MRYLNYMSYKVIALCWAMETYDEAGCNGAFRINGDLVEMLAEGLALYMIEMRAIGNANIGNNETEALLETMGDEALNAMSCEGVADPDHEGVMYMH